MDGVNILPGGFLKGNFQKINNHTHSTKIWSNIQVGFSYLQDEA